MLLYTQLYMSAEPNDAAARSLSITNWQFTNLFANKLMDVQ